MIDPKYPEDFVGWIPLYPMHNNRFLIIESPDGTREACIHLIDNEVVAIKDKATGADLYDGNKVLAEKLGLDWLYKEWRVIVDNG